MLLRQLDREAAREWTWFVALAASALLPRLAFVTLFPTTPFTDFAHLLGFALAFKEDPFATGFFGWQFFGPGMPLLLSGVLRLVPGPADEVARYATAVVTGLAALVPFVLLRGCVGLTGRVTASLLLALWPGHVAFSGVIAQDNWVLLPTLIVAALATRSLLGGGDHPVWA